MLERLKRNPGESAPLLQRRLLAQGAGWTIQDCVCMAGPRDPRFEERHDNVALALVTAGTFQYRTGAGDAVLYPGAYLLGNAGACFECGHTHSAGDRCIALHTSRELFEEVATSVAGSSRFTFRQPMLPAHPDLTALATSLSSVPARAALAIDELVLAAIAAAVAALRDGRPSARCVAPTDVRRLSNALQFMAAHSSEPLRLEALASLASMSKFHFLRTFQKVTGTTPYRYLLTTRLKRAADAIAHSRRPIGEIALEEGFGDLSSFNRLFRRVMGATPGQFRARFCAPRPA